MSKKCTKCNKIKELDCFSKFIRNNDSLNSWCKLCCNKYTKERYQIKRKEISEKHSQYYIENKKERDFYSKEYKVKNIEKIKLKDKKYRQNNKGKRCARTAKRRTSRLNAALKGFEQEILDVYNEATRLQRLDGIKRHVHHILPLQQFCDIYCGLHVPWNLEILTEEEHIEAHKKLLLSIRII